MKIVLIVIGVIALACIALEIASKISAKREKARWDKLSRRAAQGAGGRLPPAGVQQHLMAQAR